jgi:hypothetical protein
MLSIFFILAITSCQPLKYKMPTCIKNKITEFEVHCCENGANVKEYKFQGEYIYVFDHGTCGADMTSQILSEDYISLGYLGGITGNYKIQGEDFSNAEFRSICWEK